MRAETGSAATGASSPEVARHRPAVSGTNREECLNREGIRKYPQLSAVDAALEGPQNTPANPHLFGGVTG